MSTSSSVVRRVIRTAPLPQVNVRRARFARVVPEVDPAADASEAQPSGLDRLNVGPYHGAVMVSAYRRRVDQAVAQTPTDRDRAVDLWRVIALAFRRRPARDRPRRLDPRNPCDSSPDRGNEDRAAHRCCRVGVDDDDLSLAPHSAVAPRGSRHLRPRRVALLVRTRVGGVVGDARPVLVCPRGGDARTHRRLREVRALAQRLIQAANPVSDRVGDPGCRCRGCGRSEGCPETANDSTEDGRESRTFRPLQLREGAIFGILVGPPALEAGRVAEPVPGQLVV